MSNVDALFDAIAAGDEPRVRRFIDADVALARANDGSVSAIVFARYMGHSAIVDLLIERGPALSIFEAATADRPEYIRNLAAEDATAVAGYDQDGFTALHLAAFYGASAAAEALLDAGADVAAVTRNFLANMPLHAAAAGGHRDVMKLLLARGADPDTAQHGGFRPLHSSAFRNDRPMAELLLSHGADPGAPNDDEQTAAEVARANGNLLLAAWLQAQERLAATGTDG